MAYEISIFDNRPRVVALQATAHACAAAAAADIVGELFGMPGVGAGQVQQQLIDDLGGLLHRGTTFADVSKVLAKRFKREIEVSAPVGVSWDEMLRLQAAGIGVVIALANAGSNEGHAVRVLGASRPLVQDDEREFQFLTHPRPFTDLAMKVQIFDPWPHRPSPVRVERHLELRQRFEMAGRQCLLIRPTARHS